MDSIGSFFLFFKNCRFKIKTTLKDCDQEVANAYLMSLNKPDVLIKLLFAAEMYFRWKFIDNNDHHVAIPAEIAAIVGGLDICNNQTCSNHIPKSTLRHAQLHIST